jgi:N-acetylmuramoyl-L-alanine amidase
MIFNLSETVGLTYWIGSSDMPCFAVFPGHVGKDSGAIDPAGGGDFLHTIEATVTLSIAHKVCSLLDLMGIDYRFLPGSFEARIKMSEGCTCGLSIHADISLDKSIHGYHVMYYPRSKKGKLLAENLDESLKTTFHRARKVHSRRDLAILRRTSFPCALVEVGFLSNQIDEAELLQPHYQHRFAIALVTALIKAFPV